MGHVTVLAGTNGAGKSSIGGADLRRRAADYFNPDEVTLTILKANPDLGLEEANVLAWQKSLSQLEIAIENDLDYTFETTLGGNTITRTLIKGATEHGCRLSIWYCGLESPERHIARVKSRVAAGGHDIPEAKIRQRYDASREHLVELMPHLQDLRVYDNSAELDPGAGLRPSPVGLLEITQRTLKKPTTIEEIAATPRWAKAIVAAALEYYGP